MLKKKFKLPISLFPVSAKTVLKDEYFTVKSHPNQLGVNRLGVTFRSKAFKTAVLRNRLKRAVFDFFRTHYPYKSAQSVSSASNDLLIILNPPIIKLTKDKIKAALETIIKKTQA